MRGLLCLLRDVLASKILCHPAHHVQLDMNPPGGMVALGCSTCPACCSKLIVNLYSICFTLIAGALQLDVNSDTVNSELVQEHEKRLEGWSTAELELFFTELVMELQMVSCLSAAAMIDC